ncbi:MAG: hypothetical protein AAFR97_15780, partial [Bacteroidota bacterium]
SGRNTIRTILYRYAPPGDNNNTEAYIQAVAAATSYGPETPLTANREVLTRLVIAMARHENGLDAVSMSQFNEAWSLL